MRSDSFLTLTRNIYWPDEWSFCSVDAKDFEIRDVNALAQGEI